VPLPGFRGEKGEEMFGAPKNYLLGHIPETLPFSAPPTLALVFSMNNFLCQSVIFQLPYLNRNCIRPFDDCFFKTVAKHKLQMV